MKVVIYIGVGFLLIFSAHSLSAQQRVYQLSGLILNQATGDSIPYARIQVNKTRRGTLSNEQGFYSIPVTENDTLYFNHIGYYSNRFIVRQYLRAYGQPEQPYIYAIHYMRPDTLTLPAVNIFPYDTPEELKTAIVHMDVSETSQLEVAQQNLDPKVLLTIMQTLPKDGGERIMIGRQMYNDNYKNRNLVPTLGLGFDPLAAARLLQYVAQKTKKRKNKDLNYWE